MNKKLINAIKTAYDRNYEFTKLALASLGDAESFKKLIPVKNIPGNRVTEKSEEIRKEILENADNPKYKKPSATQWITNSDLIDFHILSDINDAVTSVEVLDYATNNPDDVKYNPSIGRWIIP